MIYLLFKFIDSSLYANVISIFKSIHKERFNARIDWSAGAEILAIAITFIAYILSVILALARVNWHLINILEIYLSSYVICNLLILISLLLWWFVFLTICFFLVVFYYCYVNKRLFIVYVQLLFSFLLWLVSHIEDKDKCLTLVLLFFLLVFSVIVYAMLRLMSFEEKDNQPLAIAVV